MIDPQQQLEALHNTINLHEKAAYYLQFNYKGRDYVRACQEDPTYGKIQEQLTTMLRDGSMKGFLNAQLISSVNITSQSMSDSNIGHALGGQTDSIPITTSGLQWLAHDIDCAMFKKNFPEIKPLIATTINNLEALSVNFPDGTLSHQKNMQGLREAIFGTTIVAEFDRQRNAIIATLGNDLENIRQACTAGLFDGIRGIKDVKSTVSNALNKFDPSSEINLVELHAAMKNVNLEKAPEKLATAFNNLFGKLEQLVNLSVTPKVQATSNNTICKLTGITDVTATAYNPSIAVVAAPATSVSEPASTPTPPIPAPTLTIPDTDNPKSGPKR